MLLAIITMCTRAQLHSKTISGVACVASVSVRFLSRESKTARPLHSLSYDLYSVLGQPKSIKKFFPGYYIQSWRKFKLFSRKNGIQGLFKTVRTLHHSQCWPIQGQLGGLLQKINCHASHFGYIRWYWLRVSKFSCNGQYTKAMPNLGTFIVSS